MDPAVKLVWNPELNEPNRSNTFVKRLGELQYIANGMYTSRHQLSCKQAGHIYSESEYAALYRVEMDTQVLSGYEES